MAQVLQAEKELTLVFGGGGVFTKEEHLLFEEAGIANRVQYAPINNDQSLIGLYKNAVLFVYPSLYEGFGLPILEAFSCGVPCVASAGSSIQEVGAEAAAYFDPTSSDAMAVSVLETFRNKKRQQELVTAGYERMKKFGWDITLEQTLAAYRNLI